MMNYEEKEFKKKPLMMDKLSSLLIQEEKKNNLPRIGKKGLFHL